MHAGRGLEELERRRLITSDVDEVRRYRVRHPYVRQFGKTGDDAKDAKERAATWAAALAHQHGGDRQWRRYHELRRRWTNIRHGIESLLPSRPREFLAAWRDVDYFLWTSGRWVDRIALFCSDRKEICERNSTDGPPARHTEW